MISNPFSREKDKPTKEEIEKLADQENSKRFKKTLKLLFHEAFMAGKKEALIDKDKEDKTFKIVVIVGLMQAVALFMLYQGLFA